MLVVSVETAPGQHCENSRHVVPRAASGFLSRHVTIETGIGSPECPWLLHGREGQHINLTLYDFAPSLGNDDICHVYAVVQERDISHTICSGSSRISHVYTSRTYAIEVRIMEDNPNEEYPEYFLLKYESKAVIHYFIYNILHRQKGQILCKLVKQTSANIIPEI